MVRLGIIGAGLIGQLHAKSSLGNALISIDAVCDLKPEAAQKISELTGARAYTDIDAMLAGTPLDAVIVSTPDNLHSDAVIKAAGAGKAIMIEKPFATVRGDAVRMMEAIRQNGVITQMAHLFRFLPLYINIQKAVAAGELGDILSTNVLMLNRLSVPTKMLKWAASSSPSWFLLSHAIDTILWVNGCRAKSVSAQGIRKKLVSMGVDTYDLIKVTAELENGVISTFEANWVIPDSLPVTAAVKMMVSGTAGAMMIDTGDQVATKALESSYSLPGFFEYDLYGYYSGLRRNMIETFARCVENHVVSPTTAQDGFDTFCVLEAVDRSLKSGEKETVLYNI
jgi:predicted dehydrogenase